MAPTPNGKGYILLGRDGGIFTFGNAKYYGSTGGKRLNAPVRDLTLTADGHGYWFVAADGGVFSFGNARFHGSTGNIRLAAPVKSMTAAANGSGYWMVAVDGGIFAFGVPYKGSLPAVRGLLGMPYVPSIRMRALPSSDGYYILGLERQGVRVRRGEELRVGDRQVGRRPDANAVAGLHLDDHVGGAAHRRRVHHLDVDDVPRLETIERFLERDLAFEACQARAEAEVDAVTE